jgi:hypothetical protein
VGLKSLKSLNLTNGYPNNKNNKVKSKPLELFELAGKNCLLILLIYVSLERKHQSSFKTSLLIFLPLNKTITFGLLLFTAKKILQFFVFEQH